MDFRTTTVARLAGDVAERRISARELIAGALARIDSLNPEVNAFVAVDPASAMAEAGALDSRIAAGEDVGPLAGIPIGVKDLEDAAGFRTTYGCALHAEDPPATQDSPFVERLRAAGCVVVGKTNTPENGYKADTHNQIFGGTGNPWDLSRSAGGSSGGSAAAIASGMVPLATGSDGGGSIRIPAAFCGLSALKPSLGRVPVGGTAPPTWADLSTRGPMTLRIRDAALAFDATVGPEPTDLRSLPMPEASWSRSLADLHVPHRLGWAPTLGYALMDSEVADILEQAVEAIEDLGAEIIEVDPVFLEDPLKEWLTLISASDHYRFGALYGTEDWERLDPGHAKLIDYARTEISAADLIRAHDACHTANVRLVELFHRVPLLLCPTVGGQAGRIGELGLVDGEPQQGWAGCTYPFNMTRSPAGTVCVGFTDAGMPVGLQVVGPQHADVAVLRMLALVEDAFALDRLAPVG